jgi:hypothetical protein
LETKTSPCYVRGRSRRISVDLILYPLSAKVSERIG